MNEERDEFLDAIADWMSDGAKMLILGPSFAGIFLLLAAIAGRL